MEEIQSDNKFQLAKETLRLDMEKEKQLEEYEENLKQDNDKEVAVLQKNFQTLMNNEQREFEIQNIKQDQYYEQELERQK